MCNMPGGARCAGLLINGEKQLTAAGQLGGRPFQRFRVSDLSMSGKWKYGLELHSAHMAAVKNCNITGECDGKETKGCLAGILMHGKGSPTDNGIEGCRIFHVGIGADSCYAILVP